jgi:hypothetical protein
MNDAERFYKILRNVMLSDHYALVVDGVASRVYEHGESGTMNIGIGEPVCEDIRVAGCHDFVWANDYIGCYDALGKFHDIELIKYVKLSELLH